MTQIFCLERLIILNNCLLGGSCAALGEVEKMNFGFNGCTQSGAMIKEGSLIVGQELDYFMNIMKNENKDCRYVGFTYHPTLKFGQFISKYDRSCQSPSDQSWPLYLAAEGEKIKQTA